jgi:hypothetical protein
MNGKTLVLKQYEVRNGPWKLGKVCRLWRDVSMTSGILWSTITISIYNCVLAYLESYVPGLLRSRLFSYEEGHRRLLEGLNRSLQSDLRLKFISETAFRQFVPLFCQYADRWVSLELWEDWERLSFSRSRIFPLRDNFPLLHTLTIRHRGERGITGHLIPIPHIFLTPPPALSSIMFHRFNRISCHGTGFDWRRVTHPSLRRTFPMPKNSGIECLAEILDAAKNLTHMEVSPHVILSTLSATPITITQHAALKRLSIDPPSSLQYLLLPHLESLRLNVEVPEPGDEEKLSELQVVKNFLSESQCSLHELIINGVARAGTTLPTTLSFLEPIDQIVTHLTLDFQWYSADVIDTLHRLKIDLSEPTSI